MNFLKNLYKDNINRYSFNSVSWITVISIIIDLIIFTSFAIHITITNIDTMNAAYLITTICSIFIIFPCSIVTCLYQYSFLRKKEQQYPNFRIKNKLINDSIFYKIFTIILFAFSILSAILFIIFCVFCLIYNITPILIGLFIYSPISIITLLLNIIFDNFFLNRLIDKKYQ